MFRAHRGEEDGQIIPALLLAVVAILFFGLLFVQVGSAAEQKTQTQTAVDSAAVAGAHRVRDYAITQAPLEMHWSFEVLFAPAAAAGVFPQIQAAACQAAEVNWGSNPHHNTTIDCGGSLLALRTPDGVRVDLTAPAGQVVTGPADVADQRAQASAVARVAFARCPLYGTPIQSAIAHWILDHALISLGVGSACFTPADETLLDDLDEESFGTASLAVGPPGLILDAVRAATRVEIVD